MPSSRAANNTGTTDNRLIIIANPTAGAGAGRANRQRLIECAKRDLERGGFTVDIGLESNPEAVSDLAEQAVRTGYSRVVAAGGDGTINAVVNGMMRLSREHHGSRNTRPLKEVALGVLPVGTANVFAFNMNIGKTWREACQVIRAGNIRRIDVGLARSTASHSSHGSAKHGTAKSDSAGSSTSKHPTSSGSRGRRRHFLLMAGIGFDAKVVEDTSLRLKYVLRDFAYVLMTLQNVVLHQGTQVTLQFNDGRVYANESWLVMVGNAASYAWDIKVTSHARLDDGVLDVCLMPFENKLVSIQQALQVLTGQHIERGIAQYWQVESVHVISDPPVPIQLDGDEWGYTPVEISVVPSALNVLAPPETQL